MSWPVAAARSHCPAPRWPPRVPSRSTPSPQRALEPARCSLATHPGKGPACCHPCLMGRHVQGMGMAMHIHGQGPCQPALVSGGFFHARTGLQSPPRGCPSVLAHSSPPSPLPAWWDASPCPGRAAPEVTFGGRPSPGACHHGSKGRLMGGFYYSQFCRGILPLFIMAFPPRDGGEAQGKAGAGCVCSNVSRCVFRAMVFGAKPFSALPVCWILHPFGRGRQSPFLGVPVPLRAALRTTGQIPGQGRVGEGHKGINSALGQNHLHFKQHRLPQTLLQAAAIQGVLIFSLYIFCS